MKALHLICKGTKENKANGLEPNRLSDGSWASKGWNFKGHEAESLVGGMIYFHRKKANTSFFGGKVLSWEWTTAADVARANRIRFIFEFTGTERYQKWRGQDHTRAWTSRIIDIEF